MSEQTPSEQAPSEQAPSEQAPSEQAPSEQASPTPSLELATPRPSKSTAGPGATPVGSNAAVFPVGQIDPALESLAGQATDDLARRLEVAPNTVAVATATVVTWSDTSLGCPQPGMRYEQVPQDGALIELEHEGCYYRYHVGGSGRSPFLCDQPLPSVPTATPR